MGCLSCRFGGSPQGVVVSGPTLESAGRGAESQAGPSQAPGLAPAESHENAIGPVDLSGVQAEALASRHAELKDRLRSIGQGFDWLRRVSHQGYGAETGEPPPSCDTRPGVLHPLFPER